MSPARLIIAASVAALFGFAGVASRSCGDAPSLAAPRAAEGGWFARDVQLLAEGRFLGDESLDGIAKPP